MVKHKVILQLTMDPDLVIWLKSESVRRRTTVSAIVREMVAEKMENQNVRKTDQGTTGK